jgi:hypothetical protein
LVITPIARTPSLELTRNQIFAVVPRTVAPLGGGSVFVPADLLIAALTERLITGVFRRRSFAGDVFAGYGIDELLRAATGYCADGDLDDQEFLERLNGRQPSQLPQWQLLHLVGICRHVAGLDVPFQEDLEAAFTVAV